MSQSPQREDSRQSSNTGSSTGICTGSPGPLPMRFSLPLAPRSQGQPLGRMGTPYSISAVALQIQFLINQTLYTKRKFHLQRIRAKLNKARGPGWPPCFQWKQGQLHPLSPSREGGRPTQISPRPQVRKDRHPHLEKARVPELELDTSHTSFSVLLATDEVRSRVLILQTRRGRLKVFQSCSGSHRCEQICLAPRPRLSTLPHGSCQAA